MTVETDRLRRTKIVQAGSGFLSQHSKELLFGLGASQRVLKLTVEWPSGATQVFTDVPLNTRLRLVEGGALETRAVRADARPSRRSRRRRVAAGAAAGRDVALRAVSRRPTSRSRTCDGQTRSLAALRGRPAVLLFWSSDVGGSRAALDALARGQRRAGAGRRRRARRRARCRRRTCRRSARRPPARAARDPREPRARPELRDPQPPPVHEPAGPASADGACCSTPRAGSSRPTAIAWTSRAILRDARDDRGDSRRASRASRAVRRARSTRRRRCATTCPTGGSCSIRGWRPRRSSPSSARRRRARAPRRSIGWARCWRRAAKPARARRLRARARAAAGPRRSEQRPRRAARAGRRPRRRRSSASARRSPRRPTTPMRSTTSATRCS